MSLQGSRGRRLLLGALLFLVTAAARAETEPLTEQSGVLRVGTSGDYPPFSRGGEGFDVAVARELAETLGLEIVWVPFRWPTLTSQIESGDFDLAMGGITWRAERAAVGRMSRALAQGGPCLVGSADPKSIAVNRGGILERWARSRFDDRRVTTTDDNLELPELLADGDVEAFVTDSFEVQHFSAGRSTSCEPPVDRKVYWFAPGRTELAEAVDRWIAENEPTLLELRRTHFGTAQPRAAEQHLVDLLARRFAFMPHVARYKRERGLAIADLAQEARILDGAARAARERGLEPEPVRKLFALWIDLAKRLQERTGAAAATLDLQTQIRPALLRLTPRLLDALAAVQERGDVAFDGALMAPLGQWLLPEELDELGAALSSF